MPASSERRVQLPESVALHARPAANFVRTAMGFGSEIMIAHDGREADAKSLLAVLGLGALGGTSLELRATGADADAAVEALVTCVGNFTE